MPMRLTTASQPANSWLSTRGSCTFATESSTVSSTRSCSARAKLRVGTRTQCPARDRKSTRLNSSHSQISYAVFCLKKKKKQKSSRLDLHAIQTSYCDTEQKRS